VTGEPGSAKNMLHTLKRWLRHRWWDETDARRALGEAALARLAARVAQSESGHSGQIRLCVEAGLPLSYLWRGASARERALTLFGKLRVWDTEHNNGVLVYLLLADRAIEIVADRALARQVPEAVWRDILSQMRSALGRDGMEAALTLAIDAVDGLLRAGFPRGDGHPAGPNELPDGVDVR